MESKLLLLLKIEWIKTNPLLKIPYFRNKERKWEQDNIRADIEKLRKSKKKRYKKWK